MMIPSDDERAPMRVVLHGAESIILNAVAENNLVEASAMTVLDGERLKEALLFAAGEDVDWALAIADAVADNNVDWELLFKACLPHIISHLRSYLGQLEMDGWMAPEDSAKELEELTALMLGA